MPTQWEESYKNAQPRAFDNPPPGGLSYRNAAIVMLLHTPLLLNWLRDIHPENHKCDDKDMGLVCAFWRLSTFYWLGDPSNGTHETYMRRVWDKLCATRWNDKKKEQDSWRFLREFFNQFFQELENDPKRQDEMNGLFPTKFKTRRICQYCKRESPINHGQVLLFEASFKKVALQNPMYKIAEAIQHKQQLGMPPDGEPAWSCADCNKPDERDNSFNPIAPLRYIISLPEVLFVRVEHTDNAGRTLGLLELEDNLTIPANWQYPGTPRQDIHFELYSIIFHWAHDRNNGTVVEGDYNVCAVEQPGSADRWALTQNGLVSNNLSLKDVLERLDKEQRPVLLAYRRLPLNDKLTKPTVDPRFLMKQTLNITEGVKWSFDRHLSFPDGGENLMKLGGKARTHRAKLNVAIISEATGETLEGEATISLAATKRKRLEASAVPGGKKRGRPLGSVKIARAKLGANSLNVPGSSKETRRPSGKLSKPFSEAGAPVSE